jgi:hypothetical protein
VFVHSLKKVDITAQVGSTTTAALAIRGAASDRQVATYSSKPSLLQPQPPHMLLPAGGVAELGLVFRPVTTGTEQVSAGDACGDANPANKQACVSFCSIKWTSQTCFSLRSWDAPVPVHKRRALCRASAHEPE